jgi:hypothetical protein
MSQIETIGGKNAIIFVQKLMPSLRGTNATKQCAATCVALHCLAVAYDDGVRCRKINTIWLASTADMARKSVPAAAHIPPNTRPAKWTATFCPSRGLPRRQLICPSGHARTNAVVKAPARFPCAGPWGGQNPAFPAPLSSEMGAAESETRVDSSTEAQSLALESRRRGPDPCGRARATAR